MIKEKRVVWKLPHCSITPLTLCLLTYINTHNFAINMHAAGGWESSSCRDQGSFNSSHTTTFRDNVCWLLDWLHLWLPSNQQSVLVSYFCFTLILSTLAILYCWENTIHSLIKTYASKNETAQAVQRKAENLSLQWCFYGGINEFHSQFNRPDTCIKCLMWNKLLKVKKKKKKCSLLSFIIDGAMLHFEKSEVWYKPSFLH